MFELAVLAATLYFGSLCELLLTKQIYRAFNICGKCKAFTVLLRSDAHGAQKDFLNFNYFFLGVTNTSW